MTFPAVFLGRSSTPKRVLYPFRCSFMTRNSTFHPSLPPSLPQSLSLYLSLGAQQPASPRIISFLDECPFWYGPMRLFFFEERDSRRSGDTYDTFMRTSYDSLSFSSSLSRRLGSKGPTIGKGDGHRTRLEEIPI